MKIKQLAAYALFFTGLFLLLSGCSETKQDNVFQRLDIEAGINTFPLTIVITGQLHGNVFPAEIQQLCGLSKSKCKSLPMAGILRVGPDQYYTYNCISGLQIPATIKNNESAITDLVEQQVNTYYASTKLINYDSLLIPNNAGWNMLNLASNYISKTADSIFFFSSNPNASSEIELGNNRYVVYKDVQELRSKINDLVCKGNGTVSVFYNPSFDTAGIRNAGLKFPPKGTRAGDTCLDHAKYERLHNGKGGFITGRLIEANSVDCGYVFPTGVAGDTCVSGSRYQKLHNGKGGFSVGSLVERNSRSCGYTPPPVTVPETRAATKAPPVTAPEKRIETKVPSATKAPPVTAPAPRTEKPAPVVPAPTPRTAPPAPARGTAATGTLNYNGVKYEKLNDGKGGFMRGKALETKTPETRPAETKTADTKTAGTKTTETKPARGGNKCVTSSEPTCEKDESGNYTGRRVQYCYDAAGKVIRTIVISKCESDCRCLGM